MTFELFNSAFPMLVSLAAMAIQLTFGVLNVKRAKVETERQIAETKKQEMLLVIQTEETYKGDVRQWGLEVLDAMAQAQQLCTIDPDELTNHDFAVEKLSTVAGLRSLLNRAKWLFPNLAIPARDDPDFTFEPKRHHSALETILYAYHTLDRLDPEDPEQRKTAQTRIRRFRNEFVKEMRQAVDPQVRGKDIETLVAELHTKRAAAEQALSEEEE